ncbi:hypothetical protein [Shewanella marina]|uniref:hypothetical protein n=1 Tax=Shewanella marina TaxID=487319 RepID=UPI000472D4F4|nr:hypothetical protein [Shewanella marina]
MTHSQQRLAQCNAMIEQVLAELNSITAEDLQSDDLVLNLQSLINDRQQAVTNVITDPLVEDAAWLTSQISLTEDYSQQLIKLKDHRQQLLYARKSNQRRVGVYQSIEANR